MFKYFKIKPKKVTKTAGLRYGSSLTQRLEKPKELFLDKPKEMLDTRKKGYDAFKGKLVLSRNLWITGAVCGIVAAVVGTFYTYEAILIQRRSGLFMTKSNCTALAY